MSGPDNQMPQLTLDASELAKADTPTLTLGAEPPAAPAAVGHSKSAAPSAATSSTYL